MTHITPHEYVGRHRDLGGQWVFEMSRAKFYVGKHRKVLMAI